MRFDSTSQLSLKQIRRNTPDTGKMSHKGNSGKGKKSTKSGGESKSEDVLQAVVGDMAGYHTDQEQRKLTLYLPGHRRLFSRQIQAFYHRKAKSNTLLQTPVWCMCSFVLMRLFAVSSLTRKRPSYRVHP